jgi:hypothetical protein
MRRRRLVDTALGLAVAAIAVAAVVNVVQADGAEPASVEQLVETEARPSPEPEEAALEPEEAGRIGLPGRVREAGGLIWWTSPYCAARVLDVSSGSVWEIPGTRCRIWPAPTGRRLITAAADRDDATEGRGLVEFAFSPRQGEQALGDPVTLRHEPGIISSDVAWSPDGTRALTCVATPDGTVVVPLAGKRPRRVLAEDACFPAVLADGQVALAAGAAGVSLEGRPLLSRDDLTRLLPDTSGAERRAVSALAAGTGTEDVIAAFVAVDGARQAPSSAALAVLDTSRGVRFSTPLPEGVLPAAVGLAPVGDALWYFDAADGTAHVVDVPGGRELPPYGSRWAAWSPSGGFVALAARRSVGIFAWPELVEVARIPVAAATVFWTRAPGG